MGFGIATQTGVSAAIQSIPSMMANKGLRNGYGATFAENFTDGTNTLDPRITFSRASNATVTGSNGLIQYAPNNLLLNSEQFDNSYWTKENVTVTANTVAAPDGTTTADSVVSGASGYINFRRAGTTVTANTAHTASIYVKAGTGATSFSITLVNNTFTSGVTSVFNLSTGAVTSTTPIGTATNTSSTITAVGSGWYRVTSTAIVDATSTSIRVDYVMGNYSSTIYAWGAQLNVGSLQSYNPTTVKNLLGYSEAFDNAAWSKSNASVTANTSATAAPNGTFTVDKLVEDTANSTHFARQTPSGTVNTSPYTLSVYAKAAERSYLGLALQEGSPFTRQSNVNFNLANGTVGAVSSLGGSVGTASMTPVGDGWYRCSLTVTLGGSATSILAWNYISTAGGFTYQGDGTSGIYIWGAQLSDSASLDPYVNNPVAAPTAAAYYGARFDYDPVTLQPKGLLIEEQRTNLLIRSEEVNTWSLINSTVTANTTTSPDGTVDADKLIEDTATSTHYAANGFTPANATTYTGSVYLKAAERGFAFVGFLGGSMATTFVSVNLSTGAVTTATGTPLSSSSTAVGNGWYRVTISLTSTGTTASNLDIRISTDGLWANRSYTGNGTSGIYVWGAQLEAGAFATSYIPTTASQVTRSADVALIQGSNFSGWYNVNQGSFVTNTQLYNATARNAAGFDVQDGTTNNRIIFRAITTGSADQMVVRSGGTTVATLSSASVSTPARKTGMGVKLDDFAMVSQGGDIYSDNSGAMPVGVSQMLLGSATGGAEFLNGYIRSLAYYPTRLQNSQLQAVTQ